MKAVDLKELTYEELAEEAKALKAELFKLRFQLATSDLENPMKLRSVKKDIARIKTVMREMELKGNHN